MVAVECEGWLLTEGVPSRAAGLWHSSRSFPGSHEPGYDCNVPRYGTGALGIEEKAPPRQKKVGWAIRLLLTLGNRRYALTLRGQQEQDRHRGVGKRKS